MNEPVPYSELIVDDIITYATRSSEWKVTEIISNHEIRVECIKHVRPSYVGYTKVLDSDTFEVYREWE